MIMLLEKDVEDIESLLHRAMVGEELGDIGSYDTAKRLLQRISLARKGYPQPTIKQVLIGRTFETHRETRVRRGTRRT